MPTMLERWRAWAQTEFAAGQPYVLREDCERMETMRRPPTRVHIRSWDECCKSFDPWADTGELHVGLLPLPFIGDALRAKVYFLLANPGLSANDYYAEHRSARFRQRLLANLCQQFNEDAYPFFPLDPDVAWHAGNAYWEKKLKKVVLGLAQASGAPHDIVRKVLGRALCSIELVPYHSQTTKGHHALAANLPSSELAIRHVSGLVARAGAGKCLVIAMRAVRHWNLPDTHGFVQFTSGLARGAHLSTARTDSAGSRIVEFLREDVLQELGQPAATHRA